MSYIPRLIYEKPFNLLNEQAFEANRRGELTPNQKKQAQATVSWAGIIFVIILIMMIGSPYIFLAAPSIVTRNIYNSFETQLIALLLGILFLAFLIPASARIFRHARKTHRIWHDIANRAIHQGQGQIVHTRKGYVFEMDGNTLQLHLNGNLNNGLLPGITYQVYYLEKSRFLLSAKTTQPHNPALTQAVLNDILASTNRFSAQDLLTNQNGQIAPNQYRRLIPNTFAGVGFLLLSILFILPAIVYPPNVQAFSLIFWIIVALFGILPMIGLIILIKVLLDVLTRKPQQVQGPIYKEKHLVYSGRYAYMEYNYRINGKRFTVSQRAYTALIDGLHYRIYYLHHSKKLISIETMLVPNTSSRFDQP